VEISSLEIVITPNHYRVDFSLKFINSDETFEESYNHAFVQGFLCCVVLGTLCGALYTIAQLLTLL
jgi:hypothetical protein